MPKINCDRCDKLNCNLVDGKRKKCTATKIYLPTNPEAIPEGKTFNELAKAGELSKHGIQVRTATHLTHMDGHKEIVQM